MPKNIPFYLNFAKGLKGKDFIMLKTMNIIQLISRRVIMTHRTFSNYILLPLLIITSNQIPLNTLTMNVFYVTNLNFLITLTILNTQNFSNNLIMNIGIITITEKATFYTKISTLILPQIRVRHLLLQTHLNLMKI